MLKLLATGVPFDQYAHNRGRQLAWHIREYNLSNDTCQGRKAKEMRKS